MKYILNTITIIFLLFATHIVFAGCPELGFPSRNSLLQMNKQDCLNACNNVDLGKCKTVVSPYVPKYSTPDDICNTCLQNCINTCPAL